MISLEYLRRVYEKLAADERAQSFYARLPRSTWWNNENRQCSTGILAKAASLTDLIHRMQQTILFSVNTETEVKELAVDWLVEQYRLIGIDIDRMPPAWEESPVSNPAISVDRSGRRLSVDFFRVFFVSCVITRVLPRGR